MHNNSLPLLSIIIPVYNSENYLNQCIQSILHQPIENWELILVNDGSTDNSLQICEKFAEDDVRIKIINSTNQGPSSARNKGLKEAQGIWISFIDSDDWIDNTYFDPIIKPNNNDLIFFGYKEIKNDVTREATIKNIGCYLDSSSIDEQLAYLFKSPDLFFGFSVNKFFKNIIIKKFNLRFNESLRLKEDEDFTINYCKHISSLEIIETTPYYYRIIPESLSHRKLDPKEVFKFACAIDNNIKDLNYRLLKDSLFYQVYYYYLDSILAEPSKQIKIERFNRLDEFYKKNSKKIGLKSKIKLIHKIPYKFIRQIIFQYL